MLMRFSVVLATRPCFVGPSLACCFLASASFNPLPKFLSTITEYTIVAISNTMAITENTVSDFHVWLNVFVLTFNSTLMSL